MGVVLVGLVFSRGVGGAGFREQVGCGHCHVWFRRLLLRFQLPLSFGVGAPPPGSTPWGGSGFLFLLFRWLQC